MSSSDLPKTFKRVIPHDREANTPSQLKELPLPKPGKNEILIKVAFAPLNPSDIGYVGGGYKNPSNLSGGASEAVGLEGSGEVVALGHDLSVPYNIGDKVYILGLGTWGQYLISSADSVSVQKIQGGLSLEQAASHVINPGTVHYFADLIVRGGHKAAIHSAGASALGRMLIRYLKIKNIKLINIVRRDEYIEELTREEGADYVLNCKAPDFEAKLKEIAEKEQATIAFDAISGDMTNILLRNMPESSTVRVYGFLSGYKVNVDLGELFLNRSVAGLYFSYHVKELAKNGKVDEFFKEIHSLLPTIFKSNIQKVFNLDQYKEALEYYKENSSKGKILLKLN